MDAPRERRFLFVATTATRHARSISHPTTVQQNTSITPEAYGNRSRVECRVISATQSVGGRSECHGPARAPIRRPKPNQPRVRFDRHGPSSPFVWSCRFPSSASGLDTPSSDVTHIMRRSGRGLSEILAPISHVNRGAGRISVKTFRNSGPCGSYPRVSGQ